MTGFDPLTLVSQFASWLFLLLDMAGLIVAAYFVRLSRGMPIVLLGFAGSFLNGLVRTAVTALIGSGGLDPGRATPLFALTALVGLASNALIVVGLAAVCVDVRGRLAAWKHRVEDL